MKSMVYEAHICVSMRHLIYKVNIYLRLMSVSGTYVLEFKNFF